MKTIGVVIIARNEEEMLTRALESVKGADAIYFCDTGSSDKTVEIARKYTEHIYHFEWIKDFSAARNFVAEKAGTDWILSLDCDHELLTTIEELRSIAERAEQEGHTCVRGAFWKRGCSKWSGRVHEFLSPRPTYDYGIKKRIDYSKNHLSDPERNLNILLEEEKTPRTLFYLGREYFTLGRYEDAIRMLREYNEVSTYTEEKAESYHTIAWCLWNLHRGDEARRECMKAIWLNPTHWQALGLMAQMHYEPHKSAWAKLSKAADGSQCIFAHQRL